MFFKNYKTIIGAVVGITPVILTSFGVNLPTSVIVDISGLAIFFIGIMAKDFNVK